MLSSSFGLKRGNAKSLQCSLRQFAHTSYCVQESVNVCSDCRLPSSAGDPPAPKEIHIRDAESDSSMSPSDLVPGQAHWPARRLQRLAHLDLPHFHSIPLTPSTPSTLAIGNCRCAHRAIFLGIPLQNIPRRRLLPHLHLPNHGLPAFTRRCTDDFHSACPEHPLLIVPRHFPIHKRVQ